MQIFLHEKLMMNGLQKCHHIVPLCNNTTSGKVQVMLILSWNKYKLGNTQESISSYFFMILWISTRLKRKNNKPSQILISIASKLSGDCSFSLTWLILLTPSFSKAVAVSKLCNIRDGPWSVLIHTH